jgi:hypothetical protein
VLPLVFKGDDSVESLGLDGTQTYSIFMKTIPQLYGRLDEMDTDTVSLR